MKNLLYVIAALLIIIWGIIVISFDTSATVHIILLIAGIVILIRYLQNKKQVKSNS